MSEYSILDDQTYFALEEEAIREAVEGWMIDDVLSLLGKLHPDVEDFDYASVTEAIYDWLMSDWRYEIDELGDVYVRDDDFEKFVTALDVTKLVK